MSSPTLNAVVIGISAIGKTTMIMKICEGKFDNNQKPTMQVDFMQKMQQKDDKLTKLNFFDTSGQERLTLIPLSLVKKADVLLLCFSRNDEKSFEQIERKLDTQQKELAAKKCILVATKNDLDTGKEENELINMSRITNLSNKIEAEFISVSSLTNHRIDELESKIANQLDDIKAKTNTIRLDRASDRRKKFSCCTVSSRN